MQLSNFSVNKTFLHNNSFILAYFPLMLNKTYLFILSYLFVCSNYAQTFNIDSLNGNSSNFLLHHSAKVFNLKEKELSVDEFITQKSTIDATYLTDKTTNTGFTNGNYWMEFSVNNTTNLEKHYYLETTRPITDFVYLYTNNSIHKNLKQQSGDAIPFNKRDFKSHKSVFKVILPPNEITTFYLNFKSDGEVVNFNLNLHQADDFIYASTAENLLFGIFYGVIFLATITYLFFYFALRDKTFLYYSLYVITIGFMQFALDGFWFKYVGPSASAISLKGVILFATLATLFFGMYGKSYLKVALNNKFFMTAYNTHAAFVLGLLIVLVLPFNIPSFGYLYINTLALLALLLVIVSIVYCYIKGEFVDAFFTIGILSLATGMTIFILNNFGIIHTTFLVENSSKIGTGVEVIFLSLSMANLIRNLKSEKEMAQTIALKKSEDMNELKSYFMSNMSHELRTPLNAIMGISDVMLKENIDPKIRSNFEIIKYASVGLLSSVNDILDFNKIEKGELVLNNIEFEPRLVLEQIKYNSQNQAKDKNLELAFEISKNLPFKIKGDPMRFTQIVTNVINNAIKFTNSGYVNVEVDTINKNDDLAELQIIITDSGVGIPENKLDSIYESFMQESITNTRKYGGLGLGLSIVKKLIDLHKGQITIDSKVGVGTTCKFTIPCIITLNQPIQPKIPAVTKIENNSRCLNILVVEDNTVNQLLMKMILKRWENTTFVIANNGVEALDKLKAEQFDIVLMDLQMPIMDGYEATIAIRAGEVGDNNSRLPIIAITADVMEGTANRVMEIGMNAYLTKPVNQQTLFDMVIKLTTNAEVD